MKFMTEEKIKKYPTLAYACHQCQSYSMRTYGGCTGCSVMVAGCEKVIAAGTERDRKGGAK